ncbi:UDP-forming cellulose synthase catalytic subunit [Acetobacter okinawensis]|uniref:UDP-forming cellulose synthase catalytic subunit n=1 Tax=Acetobacter okinawensis TaxID=1076594 RepID=UPI0039EAD57B
MKLSDRLSNLFRVDRGVHKALAAFLLCFSIVGFFVVTLSFLSAGGQLIVGIAGIIAFFIINRRKDDTATLYLKILSLAVSFRYLAWRMIDTLVFQTTFQAILGIILLSAEAYAFMMLLLIYFQTVHPLERKPAPLPDNSDQWPSVDVYIPTYNEDLSIVRVTALACASMDWPPDKLNVFILDDGHRDEFRQFAESAGIGYISRADNSHAKAGNLNHALSLTDGEMIAIFDCDHVPCRAFLQTTMGWFVTDPRVGLLQTPHHFYSPDPFQRNLANGMRVPPEGNSFYGLLQPGNDFWNASFFCGSCAVIRRDALMEVGGIATETVTEDAHTALKLQRRGWSTAYLSLPLAAGLATERLILHIGQRMRWARGMIQILRTDNPFTGPGLKLPQRICYFSAMAGFLFAIPRLVFLTSPICFLVFNQTLIAASPMALCAYVLPHFFHCICTSARMNGNWRYSFWGEIYETTLATFLVRVTLVTMLFPKLGKFNVTDKGGTIKQAYLDWQAVYPNVILSGFLFMGMLYGFYRLFMFHNSQVVFNALWLNEVWISISILTLLLAIAVGHESRQVRGKARIQVRLPVTLRSEGGQLLPTHIMDVSTGGCQVEVTESTLNEWKNGQIVHVFTEEGCLKGEIIWVGKQSIGLDWRYDSLRHEAEVVRFVFGRADAWVDWGHYPPDRPLRSLWLAVSSIVSLFRFEEKPGAASQKLPPSKSKVQPRRSPVVEKKPERKAVIVAPKKKTATLCLFLLGTALPAVGWAQQPLGGAPAVAAAAAAPPAAATQAVPPAPSDSPVADGEPPLPTVNAADPASAVQDQSSQGAQAPGLTFGAPVADAAPALVGVNKKTWSLKDLGAGDTLMMTPFASIQGITFGLPKGELVTDAELVLSGALSPSLLPTVSSITIRLNNQYVGTIPVTPGKSAFGPVKFAVNPFFFLSKNVVNFSFAGQYTATCGNEISPVLWGQISGQSQLSITTAPLPPKRYLSALPAPFMDTGAVDRAVVPFVLPEQASVGNANGRSLLKSAGIVASWFGKQADFHHVTFPVSHHVAETGNAVVMGTADNLPDSLGKSLTIAGPLVAELANPSDSNGTLLVITGRNVTEVLQAANTLAYTSGSFGDLSQTGGADLSLSPRVPYDAPAFLPTDRVVRFGELVSQSALTGHGYVPGTLAIPFRIAPDLYTWRGRPFNSHFSFHPPLADNIDLQHSRVDVSLNGIYLNSFPWSHAQKLPAWLSAFLPERPTIQKHHVELPVWGVYGQNELDFYFDGRPMARRDCSAMAQDISLELDPDSVLDMRRAYHLAVMPNLALFANSGFPFTRMADLSETAIVLPEHAGTGVLTTYLDVAGLFGSYTWLPISGVDVVSSKDVAGVKDRDILMIGLATGGTQAPAQGPDLLKGSPYQIEGDRLRLKERTLLDGIRYMFADNVIQGAKTVTFQGSVSLSGGGALIGTQSPLTKGRSVVVLVAGAPQGLDTVINTIENPTLERGIQGDLTFVTGHKTLASRSGSTFTVGNAPFWIWSDWYFSEHPWRIIILAALGIVASGTVLRKMLAARAARRRAYLKQNEGNEA